MKRAIIPIFVISLILFLVIVSATTASIGNSKMVLRLSAGEEIERSIRVINSNDFPVTITLSPDGDLKDSIDIKDKEFSLSPEEEKNAYFTLKAQKSGTTESKINVLFTPKEGSSDKNSVGLVSTIIVIVNSSDSDNIDTIDDSTADNEAETDNEIITNTSDFDNNGSGFSFNLNNNNKISEKKESLKVSPLLMLSLSTIILAVILIVLFIYSSIKAGKKETPIKQKKSASKSEF